MKFHAASLSFGLQIQQFWQFCSLNQFIPGCSEFHHSLLVVLYWCMLLTNNIQLLSIRNCCQFKKNRQVYFFQAVHRTVQHQCLNTTITVLHVIQIYKQKSYSLDIFLPSVIMSSRIKQSLYIVVCNPSIRIGSHNHN